MKRSFIILELVFMLVSWQIIDSIIFMGYYSSTPFYYSDSKLSTYFKILDHISLFLIPMLFGLKLSSDSKYRTRSNIILLKIIFSLILCGLLPHVIYWLHRVISFTIYGKFFQVGLFLTVAILIVFLLLTFISVRKLSKNSE